jgi:hypothetical protein
MGTTTQAISRSASAQLSAVGWKKEKSISWFSS